MEENMEKSRKNIARGLGEMMLFCQAGEAVALSKSTPAQPPSWERGETDRPLEEQSRVVRWYPKVKSRVPSYRAASRAGHFQYRKQVEGYRSELGLLYVISV